MILLIIRHARPRILTRLLLLRTILYFCEINRGIAGSVIRFLLNVAFEGEVITILPPLASIRRSCPLSCGRRIKSLAGAIILTRLPARRHLFILLLRTLIMLQRTAKDSRVSRLSLLIQFIKLRKIIHFPTLAKIFRH